MLKTEKTNTEGGEGAQRTLSGVGVKAAEGFSCPVCKAPTDVEGTRKHASQVIRYRKCKRGHLFKTRSVIVKDPKNPKVEIRRTAEELTP